MKFAAVILGFVSTALAAVDWTATPFNPSSLPLAVRSPYLSTWLAGGSNGGRLNGAWPSFWTGSTLGWAGYIRVDGKAYTWLGAPTVSGSTLATQKSAKFTSTQTIFVLSAGPIDLTATFLSPVEPTDYLRQSLPLSYLTVTVKSTDGAKHSVQVYSDISREWITGDNSLTATWSTNIDAATIIHQIQLQTPKPFTESSDHSQYGSAYYGIANSSAVTFATGQDTVNRAAFIANGKLPNTQDVIWRAVSDRWPVLSFAKDLGSTSDSTASPTTFVVGHLRDPIIQYVTAGNVIQQRHPYWIATYSTPLAAVKAFISPTEYNHAVSAATSFDAKIASDAGAISANYANIVSLSTRQALAGVEISISKASTGAYNTSDIMVFLKEISSDGNVNTVDVIFPSWPIFLYTNPDLGRRLLEPLFAYQKTGLYPNKWSVHDLGSSYPNALGHNDGSDEAMPVEESGNMLIMTLSYAQKSGDTSLIAANYALLQQWTQYLIEDSLVPANQLSTDDFAGKLANQTNLAIKGIVGIGAMSQIATLLGKTADAANYNSIAASYVPQWQKYATAATGDHLDLNYGSDSTWGLAYNLYGDKLLKLNLFPTSVYQMQTAWYSKHANQYGVLLDTRNTWTKSDWECFTAAIMTDNATRDLFIQHLATWAADGLNNTPFPDLYETVSGGAEVFKARPVVGGHFALLALSK